MVQNSTQAAHAAKGGVIAGIVAGVALAVFMTAVSLISGHDVWITMKFAALPFLGDRALAPGFDLLAVALGATLHMGVSIFWSLFFTLLFFGHSRLATLLAGAAWGLVVWIAMYFVVLPALGHRSAALATPSGLAVLEHVLFGLALAGAFLPYQRQAPPLRAQIPSWR